MSNSACMAQKLVMFFTFLIIINFLYSACDYFILTPIKPSIYSVFTFPIDKDYIKTWILYIQNPMSRSKEFHHRGSIMTEIDVEFQEIRGFVHLGYQFISKHLFITNQERLPSPNGKRGEEMKERLKLWARSVASTVTRFWNIVYVWIENITSSIFILWLGKLVPLPFHDEWSALKLDVYFSGD